MSGTEEPPKKAARLTSDGEEIFQGYLENYYRQYLRRFTLEMPLSSPDVIIVNGRYHGLWPGDSAEDFYGGHPGLFYHMLVNAISLGTINILVIMSKTYEGPGTKYPIEPDKKRELIQKMFELLKRKLPENIIQFSHIPQKDLEGFTRWLNNKIDAVDVTIENLTFPAGNLETYIREKGLDRPRVLMITGLEEKVSKPTKKNPEPVTTWFNKYETSFKKLKEQGTISTDDFLLLGREGGISGTIIRKLIEERNYRELGKLLVNAGIDEDDFPLFGEIIAAHKGRDASQSPGGYTRELREETVTASSLGGGSKTKRHRKRSRKTRKRKLRTKRRKYSKHRRSRLLR